MKIIKKQLIKKIKFHYEMELLTGLRIGAAKESTEIGGVDNAVVRNPITKEPYIPGSSIKGKMRCLLQQLQGEMGYEHPQNGKSMICDLFGAAGDSGNASRLIVRDAILTREFDKTDKTKLIGGSLKVLKDADTDMPFTEIKAENNIDRIKGTATSPRTMERVPAGAKFDVFFVINVFEETIVKDDKTETKLVDNEDTLIALFKKAIKILEDDYLGGSGSRGYGQVKFELKNNKPETLTYANDNH